MTNCKCIVVSIFLFSVSLKGHSQTTKTIDNLTNRYLACLDTGDDMLGCSKVFYAQMDSMLNVVYSKLRSTLDTSKQAVLKKEQKLWLVKRDNYFKKTLQNFKTHNPNSLPYGSALGVQDDAMFLYNDQAKFVKERVVELLQRLNKVG